MLWLNIQDNVVLSQPMRQQSSLNAPLHALLSRVSDGTASDEDDSLQLCLIDHALGNDSVSSWYDTPMITAHNNVKDVLGIQAALPFASQTNTSVHSYYTDNYHGGDLVESGVGYWHVCSASLELRCLWWCCQWF